MARVVAHVDLDCFYVQVEQRENPDLYGKAVAVTQYSGGAERKPVIAMSYEAKAQGVKRNMPATDARAACPDLVCVDIRIAHGKADLTRYRAAGSEVVKVLENEGVVVERTSIDECYCDFTRLVNNNLKRLCGGVQEDSNSKMQELIDELKSGLDQLKIATGRERVEWKCVVLDATEDEATNAGGIKCGFEWARQMLSCSDNRVRALAMGALLVARLRLKILEKTGYTVSAGVATNKMLAKLCSGLHKPFGQTTLPPGLAMLRLLDSLPLRQLNGFGGKLGTAVEAKLGVRMVGELRPMSSAALVQRQL